MSNWIALFEQLNCNTGNQAVTPNTVTRAWVTRKADTTVKDRMRRYRARHRLSQLIQRARIARCSTWELKQLMKKALA